MNLPFAGWDYQKLTRQIPNVDSAWSWTWSKRCSAAKNVPRKWHPPPQYRTCHNEEGIESIKSTLCRLKLLPWSEGSRPPKWQGFAGLTWIPDRGQWNHRKANQGAVLLWWVILFDWALTASPTKLIVFALLKSKLKGSLHIILLCFVLVKMMEEHIAANGMHNMCTAAKLVNLSERQNSVVGFVFCFPTSFPGPPAEMNDRCKERKRKGRGKEEREYRLSVVGAAFWPSWYR